MPLSPDGLKISQTAQPVYQSALTITHGGIYSGNWQSLDPQIPAVKIKTSEPVVIQNSRLQGRGHLIDGLSGIPINLTVSNTYGYGLNPNVYGQIPGRFVTIGVPVQLVVENCYMEGTSGISIYDGSHNRSQFQIARIRYNRAHNIDGRKSNGNGGFLNDFDWAQFVQLNQMQHEPNIEIAWNEVNNEPYKSRVEENISVYLSSGTSDSPILIHDNYIHGAYPANPATNSYSGGGMMLGDGGNETAADDIGFVKAYNNQIVNTTNQGISITAGHDIEFYNNRVISSGILPDGTRPIADNVGINISDAGDGYMAQSEFYNNFGHDNTIGWIKADGTRNDTFLPSCASGKCTKNSSLPDPITLDTENAEFQTWQNKVASNNVTIGPNFAY